MAGFQRFLTICAVLATATLPAVAADAPKRIVSINVCADELLIALADPGQIASLSVFATDPTLSYYANEAKGFRHDAADAETVVELEPDLVLAGRFTKRATREMLTNLGYRVVLLDAVRSIDEALAQITEIGALVGHPERAEALAEAIGRARDAARTGTGAVDSPPTAAVYQRRGYVTGGDTLTGSLMSEVGLRNAGGDLAGSRGGFVPLERMIADPPDYLVVATPGRAADQGSALLAHPALTEIFPPAKRIILPERLTVCGGPSLPEAIDWLASEVARVTAGS